jgi:anti-sigma regulatory factor (Ser/Thr protein kinase)
MRLDRTTSDLAAPRQFVRHAGSVGSGWPDRGLELAVSELVTNALMHGEGSINVTVGLHGGGAQLAVADEGSGPEPIRFREPTATGAGGWDCA